MDSFRFAAIAFAAALAGCAGPGARESAVEPLASIAIVKQGTTPDGDCALGVTIVNRVRDTPWDGASYHLSLLDRAGKTTGRLMGAPRKPVAYGRELADSGRAPGARCEDIAGAELVYLGYYPAGKSQVNIHNHRVRVSVK